MGQEVERAEFFLGDKGRDQWFRSSVGQSDLFERTHVLNGKMSRSTFRRAREEDLRFRRDPALWKFRHMDLREERRYGSWFRSRREDLCTGY